MNLLGYPRAFGYALPNDKREIKRILDELLERGSANLGKAMTMDNVLYYRDSSQSHPVFYQMTGRPRFVSVTNEPWPSPSPDATTYYYDNILWLPNNEERKLYIKAFQEYLEEDALVEQTLLKVSAKLAEKCVKNGIFCCQNIYEELVPFQIETVETISTVKTVDTVGTVGTVGTVKP